MIIYGLNTLFRLNSFTARIPALVPVEASEEVIKILGDYLHRYRQTQEYTEDNEVVKVKIDIGPGN